MAKIYSRELRDVSDELDKALRRWPKWTDAHQGWAKLFEEVDELWDEVKLKPKKRRLKKMRCEAIQVAATAIILAMEVCGK